MRNMHWFAMVAMLAACTTEDGQAKFVGSWAYAAGSTAQVDCGGGQVFDVPFDTLVETFSESNGLLVKVDSQGCAGLEFVVDGDVASLGAAGQSCTIPAAGSNPSATFAPQLYSFTISADHATLKQALAAAYTPDGSPGSCTVTASNTLSRK